MKFDYIIVGQGIAGTLLSYELIKSEKSVLVIDQPMEGASSTMAAGIINPITGRRLIKSWMFDTLRAKLTTTYQNLEKTLKINLYNEIQVLRLFASNQEINDFEIKLTDPIYQPYLARNIEPHHPNLQQDQFIGSGIINKAAHIKGGRLLKAYRNWLITKKSINEEEFQYDYLTISDNVIYYKDWSANYIIFCEGFRIQSNPYFKYIPMVLAKGDLLTIECKDLPQDQIINKNFFILPLGSHHFHVGSTYEWEFENYKANPLSQKELQFKLEKLLSVPFKIISHTSGIRPSIKDRRPIIGFHPEYLTVGIFNGLGTKGYSLAPYFAHHFTAHLINNLPLIPEVDINRFNH